MKSTAKILDQLRQAPMLCALPALIVGIAVGQWLEVGVVVAVAGFALMVALLWRRGGDWTLLGLIMAAGVMSAALRPTSSLPEQGEMEIVVRRITRQAEGRTTAYGRVVAYRTDNTTRRTRAEVHITADGVALERGDRLLTVATARPYNTASEQERYMAAQGLSSHIFINGDNILQHCSAEPSLIESWQLSARRRIEQLGLSERARRTAAAVSIGDRGAITEALREEYSRSGGAHLLAVSGLHVGFIFAILNILLAGLTLLRGGQVIRSISIILIIWFYAAVADFSPSVIRAATMFSIMQVATTLYASARGLNTLALTAFIMLTVDARTLHDAGFQLSFLSVAAILLWVAPYLRSERQLLPSHSLWRDLSRAVARYALAGVGVSIAATAITLPLVSHLFGTISLWGILLSPLMVPLCAVTTGATLIWIVLPIAPLRGFFGWIIDHAATAMNNLAAWAAQSDVLWREVSIGSGWCWATYAILLLLQLALWAWPAPARRRFEK